MANRKPSLHKKNTNALNRRNASKKPSLYKDSTSSFSKRNNKHSSHRGFQSGNQSNGINVLSLMLSKIIRFAIGLKKNPKMLRNICAIAAILLILFLVLSSSSNDNNSNEKIAPITLIGNNSIGTVCKEGPYGNENSDITIAYILGVHPREQGAHRLMEQAIREKSDKLNCSYYLYKINVSSDASDFARSRMNGQLLAQEFAVPDMISNNISFTVDVHYSNGHWGVSRFIFTPKENNTVSNQLAHAICDNFEWIIYYTPPDPSSPDYVTGPLNDGGVPAIIYEAYTEDANNVTLEHDRQIVDFIDNWNFTDSNEEKLFFFI